MAGETFIKGFNIVLSIYDQAVGAYEPVACITSNSISESREVNEFTTHCDPGNTVKVPGAYSYEISVEGVYIDEAIDSGKQSHAKLKALMRKGELIPWRMSTGLETPERMYEYGTALLTSLELTGESASNATFSASLSGSSSIYPTDPKQGKREKVKS